MSTRIPSAVVLRAVAKPPLLLGAAPDLAKVSAGVTVLIWLFTLNGVFAMFAFLGLHAAAIWLTYRDRYVVETFKARMRCKRTRNLVRRTGNRYVA